MMTPLRRLLAVPLAVVAISGLATASDIRDAAGLFSADAIRQAKAILDKSEAKNGHPIVIETVPSLEGRDVKTVTLAGARASGNAQVYLLLAKKESKIGLVEKGGQFTPGQEAQVRAAIISGFNKKDFDAGLIRGSEALATASQSLASVGPAGAGGVARRGAPAKNVAGNGMGFFLTIGAIILVVLLVVRVLGSLFGGGNRGAGGYGNPGPGMGQGARGMGYGGGGYGGAPGGGGGFFSSMLGGIGGAVAGNWMYDQFRGRGHSDYTSGNMGSTGADPGVPENGGWGEVSEGQWGGGDAGGDAGGGDWGGGGGGDWGGGDGGGGGDWS